MTLEEIKRGEVGRLEFKREVSKHEGVTAVGNRVGNVGNAVAEDADIEQIVMDSLRGDGKVSAAKMAKIAKVTTRTIERALVRLKASGRIRRRGGTRGIWEIIG